MHGRVHMVAASGHTNVPRCTSTVASEFLSNMCSSKRTARALGVTHLISNAAASRTSQRAAALQSAGTPAEPCKLSLPKSRSSMRWRAALRASPLPVRYQPYLQAPTPAVPRSTAQLHLLLREISIKHRVAVH